MRQLCFGEASVKSKYKLYISLQHILCVIRINITYQYDQPACPLISQGDKVGQALDSMTTTLYQEIPYSLVGWYQLECFISSVNESHEPFSHCISIPAFSFEKKVTIISYQSVHTPVTFLVIESTPLL